MKAYIEQGRQALNSLSLRVAEEFSSGVRVIKSVVGDLPILVSLEKTSATDIQYDEKHYFVIPYHLSEAGFSLHTMRCLPESVPEVNDLEKRRVFHFPSAHYEACLREHLIQSTKEMAQVSNQNQKSALESLADNIDALDNKLTYGMLFLGGIAALFNPLVGAGIAAKALVPGVGGLVNKFGLRPMGEKLTRAQAEKQARIAEDTVVKQFADANTLKIVNPILQELDLALNTREDEHDPLLDPNLANASIAELEHIRWREFTEKAIYHVYKEVYENEKLHAKANLGPEDIRWFNTMFGFGMRK